jgi:hypothetical protein
MALAAIDAAELLYYGCIVNMVLCIVTAKQLRLAGFCRQRKRWVPCSTNKPAGNKVIQKLLQLDCRPHTMHEATALESMWCAPTWPGLQFSATLSIVEGPDADHVEPCCLDVTQRLAHHVTIILNRL